ncbi:MAG: MauE/DoxX family redox-associated membrane protein [Bacteroidota bacterium]
MTKAIQTMNNTSTSRTPINRRLDLIGWAVILLILIGTPLAVGLFRTPPEKGPIKDPSVLIMFLTYLSGIILFSLATWGGIAVGRVKSISDKNGLTGTGGNLVNLLSKFLGGLFIISGFVKLQDVVGFGIKLDDYWAVFQDAIPAFPAAFMRTLSVPLAGFVSVFEVVLAFALMTGYRMRITSLLLMLMLLFFTFLTGYSAITNTVTDCGCFGDALKLTPYQSFTKDIILVITCLPIYLLRKRIQPYYRAPIPLLATFGSFAIFAFISYYTYQHLPIFDFRGPYQAGQDLEYNSTNFDEEEGIIIAHDFYDFCGSCGQNGFEGPALYYVLYNVEKAPQEALDAALELERVLRTEAPGIKVCGGTNSRKQTRQYIKDNTSAAFCLDISDEKVLKTMVRSTPGFIFVMDGIVIKKWHYNDMPTVPELRELAGPQADQGPAPTLPEPEAAPPVPDSLATDSVTVDSVSGAVDSTANPTGA